MDIGKKTIGMKDMRPRESIVMAVHTAIHMVDMRRNMVMKGILEVQNLFVGLDTDIRMDREKTSLAATWTYPLYRDFQRSTAPRLPPTCAPASCQSRLLWFSLCWD